MPVGSVVVDEQENGAEANAGRSGQEREEGGGRERVEEGANMVGEGGGEGGGFYRGGQKRRGTSQGWAGGAKPGGAGRDTEIILKAS